MNRNANSRFFAAPPSLDMPRSKFTMSHGHMMSCNVGEIVPIFCMEILPGDTVKLRTSKVVRMQTLITPCFGNIYMDTYYHFVPARLVYQHWEQLMGENKDSAWIPQVEYTTPQIEAPEGGWDIGTIADHFGIPTGVSGFSVNALPFRAYALICSEWMRRQNVSDPLNVPMDDTTVTGSNGGDFVTDCVLGGKPYVAAKFSDVFTTGAPGPQKGPAVSISLGSGTVPVYGDGSGMLFQTQAAGLPANKYKYLTLGSDVPLSAEPDDLSQYTHLRAAGSSSISVDGTASDVGTAARGESFTDYEQSGVAAGNIIGLAKSDAPFTTGVYADVSQLGSVSVNSLRIAFQMQKFYEKLSRSGSRYTEILRSMFRVQSPDARLQRPEYLGGNRMPIHIHQVVQQSSTDSTSPQGNTSGYSVTSDTHSDFMKSFTEHGFLIGLSVVRYDHTYQQGLHKMWSRSDRFSYYWPVFANIGEQPILQKELYLADETDPDYDGLNDTVFAYQEAWYEYRFLPSYVSGELRSVAAQSLDVWHLADYYTERPFLSDEWIREDKSNVDRVLAVSSDVSNQIFGDFWFDCDVTRAMPLYSIPGLIDHH